MFREPRRRSAAKIGDKPVSLKLPADVVAGLDAMAVAEGRSRNSCVSRRLAEIVRNYQQEHGVPERHEEPDAEAVPTRA